MFKTNDRVQFNYLFAGDPNTTMPELLPYHGQFATILRETEDYDTEDGDILMFRIRFADGFETDAFAEELEP